MTLTPDLSADVARLFGGDPETAADPYPIYAQLREEAPVFRFGPLVVVTRYEDIKAILKDVETFSSSRGAGSRVRDALDRLDDEHRAMLLDLVEFESGQVHQNDDATHTRLRRAMSVAFTPRKVAALREFIQNYTDHVLDSSTSDGRLDLVDTLAFPLPLAVICHMLGVGEDDVEDIRAWSDAWAGFISSTYAAEDVRHTHEAIEAFRGLVGGYVAERRGDPEPVDFLGELVQARPEDRGLTDEELVRVVVHILFAGHETTTNLIGNIILALHENPDQKKALLEDPSLIKRAVDEFLRYNTSVHAIHRMASRDCELRGVEVKAGDTIRLLLASANRDPMVFDDAEKLDVQRANAADHLGLGYGIHACIGKWLAKLEAEVVVETLLSRYPEIEIAGDVTRRAAFVLQGPVEVPLLLQH